MSTVALSLEDLKARWRERYPDYAADFRGDRGVVLDMAVQGLVTPEDAQQLAQRHGWPLFEIDPDPADFDPMSSTDRSQWTMPMALAWATWRDAGVVIRQDAEYVRQRKQFGPFEERSNGTSGWASPISPPAPTVESLRDWLPSPWAEDNESAPDVPLKQAWTAMLAALQRGDLKATGRDESGETIEIPKLHWQDLDEQDDGTFGNGRRLVYRNVQVERSNVLALWPLLQSIPPHPIEFAQELVEAPPIEQLPTTVKEGLETSLPSPATTPIVKVPVSAPAVTTAMARPQVVETKPMAEADTPLAGADDATIVQQDAPASVAADQPVKLTLPMFNLHAALVSTCGPHGGFNEKGRAERISLALAWRNQQTSKPLFPGEPERSSRRLDKEIFSLRKSLILMGN